MRKTSFTFIWKVENASYCFQKKDEELASPLFVAEAIFKTQWRLIFYPRGDRNQKYVSLYILRDSDCMGPADVEITFELAFLAKDDSVLRGALKERQIFNPNNYCGFSEFSLIKDVFSEKRSAYLPKDILTIRFKMWNYTEQVVEKLRYFARTSIGVEKRHFMWNFTNFSAIETGQKYTYEIKSLGTDEQLMSIYMFVSEELNFEEIVLFELSLHDPTIKLFNLRLFLVDAYGKMKVFHEDKNGSGTFLAKEVINLRKKKNLLSKKSLYLPNDVLSLHCECTFTKGIEFNKIELVKYKRPRYKSQFSVAEKENDIKNKVQHRCVSYENLESIYEEHALCDVKLKTKSRLFPAHKVILSACSSVFKAMFTSDMAEKNSDCVNVEESDDVVSQMLQYAYTGRVEDVTLDILTQLYAAADKYAILRLKIVCSSLLKKKLIPSNACQVLLLAYSHSDVNLKSSVQDFIHKHDAEIVPSDEWKFLMENNSDLASETLCHHFA